MPKTFFTVMIESVEPEHSFIQVFWTYGNHIGSAIERVLRACSHLGIENAIAIEADDADFKSLPRSVVHDKKLNVFYAQGATVSPLKNHSLRLSES